jgi:hypothetical protein
MQSKTASAELIDLLCDAVTRELQVSVQYMMQHAIGAGRISSMKDAKVISVLDKFISSHTMYFLPGDRLKKSPSARCATPKLSLSGWCSWGANHLPNRQP